MSHYCPSCQTENRPGAKFCAACGTALTQPESCPVCNTLSTGGRFCTSCGHSFGQQTNEPAAATPQAVSDPSLVAPPERSPRNSAPFFVMLIAVLILAAGGGIWFFNFRAVPAEAVPQVAVAPEDTTTSTEDTSPTIVPPAEVPVEPVPPAEALPVQTPPVDSPPVEPPPPAPAPTAKKPVPEKKTVTPKPRTLPEEKKPSPVASPDEAVSKSPPAAPRIENSLDQQYKAMVAQRCTEKLTLLFCKESVRHSVCQGKWSENPPSGASVCKTSSPQSPN